MSHRVAVNQLIIKKILQTEMRLQLVLYQITEVDTHVSLAINSCHVKKFNFIIRNIALIRHSNKIEKFAKPNK